MNICLISTEYPPETGWGGIGTYVYNLSHGLTESGHKVHVITYTAKDEERDYMDDKVYIHRVSINNLEKRGFCSLNKYIPIYPLLRSYRYAKKLEELIDRYHIDIVEAPNWLAEGFWYILKKKKKRVPLVIRLHTPYLKDILIKNKRRSIRDHLICWLEKFSVLRCDAIVTSTYFNRREMAKIYRINEERIKIIPLGIKYPDEIGDKTEVNFNGRLRVLFVGRFERRKGIYLLLDTIPRVLKIMPEVEFYLVGKDSSDLFNNYFLKKYPELRNNVKSPGFVSCDELKQYYKNCDLFVAPSLYESFGLVYIEAMSHRKPVVALDSGSSREIIIRDNTGILIELNDSKILAERITDILSNKSLLVNMGRNGYERFVKHFTRERMVRDTIKFYYQVIGRRSE